MSDNENIIDLNGKTVLITGGTGSFGRRFAQTLLQRYKLRKLIILSRDEHKQYDMQQEAAFADHDELRYFIGDVRMLTACAWPCAAWIAWSMLRRSSMCRPPNTTPSMYPHQCERRGERHHGRHRMWRTPGDRTVHRQGGQPDQYLWR